MSTPLTVTLFESVRTPQGHRAPLRDFDELCEMLSDVVISDDKEQRGWSPAVFQGEYRLLANVERVSTLVLDVDVPTLPTMPEGLSWFAHRTFSGNWRLVVELDRSYAPKEHERLRRAVMVDFGINETLGPDGAKDSSRFYFGPTAPDVLAFETRRSTGGPLDVDAYLATVPEVAVVEATRADAPADASPSSAGVSLSQGPIDLGPVLDASTKRSIKESSRNILKEIAAGIFAPTEGRRDNSIHQAASCVATLTDEPQTDEWARTLGTIIVKRMGDAVMPEGAAHWLDKWMFSWKRSMKTRLDREAHKKAMESAFFPKTKVDEATGVEVVVDDAWKQGLIRRESKGTVTLLPVGKNIEMILSNEPGLKDLVWNTVEMQPQWRSGPLKDAHPDTLDTALVNWLISSEYHLNVSRADAAANLYMVSRRRVYEPVGEWLRSLKWDGVARAHRLLTHYFRIEGGNRHYLETISEKWLIGAVARALKPGCQMDTTLLIADNGEGGQGKTTFARILGGEWYGKLDGNIDKDALLKVTGKWVVEFAEMSSSKRTDREHMRAFLTDMTDRFRPPYGRVVQEFPRRCAFIATSNDDTPIQDAFGRRRYWPVRVENELRRDELEADRAQLFAEAVVLFEAGERWWMTREEEEVANEERGLMLEVDAFADMVMDWIRGLSPEKRPTMVNVADILKTRFSMMPADIVKAQKSSALALRAAGFTKARLSKGSMWVVPEKVLHFGMTKDDVLGRVK